MKRVDELAGAVESLGKRRGFKELVRSEHDNCMGRKCQTYDKCFYQRARREAAAANLLVANHACQVAAGANGRRVADNAQVVGIDSGLPSQPHFRFAEVVAKPTQRQPRALRYPHHMPLAGHGVAEGVDAAFRV